MPELPQLPQLPQVKDELSTISALAHRQMDSLEALSKKHAHVSFGLIGAIIVLFILLGVGAYFGNASYEKAMARAEAQEQRSALVIKTLQDNIFTRDKDIKDLQNQMSDRDAATQIQIASLAKTIAQAKTAKDVVAGLPVVTDVPLHAATIPNDPAGIRVDALPLFQTLGECKKQGMQLTTCQKDLTDETKVADQNKKNYDDEVKVAAEKDKTIEGYKNVAKKSRFRKMLDGAEKVGIFISGLYLGKKI